MTIEDQIDQITSSSSATEEKIPQYVNLFKSIPLKVINIEEFKEFAHKILRITYARVTAKPVISLFIQHIKQSNNVELTQSIYEYLLSCMQSSLAVFEVQDTEVRIFLADIYQQQDDYLKAAAVLQDGLSGNDRHLLTDGVRFETYIRIIRNYLEADMPELAEQALSKAAIIRPTLRDLNPLSDIHFRLSQARIQDSNRRFMDAANKYYGVSRESTVTDEDRLACLGQAITCAILSPAGPTRSQLLRRLYTDERSSQLPQFDLLEKAYLSKLLLAKDIEIFSKSLASHQTASLSDGTTVLTRALIDHNVYSVSKIYNNIGISELSKILGLEQARAEAYAAKMISQNRLAAKIDQVDGFIYFKSALDGETGAGAEGNNYDYASGNIDGNGLVVIKNWNVGIQEICTNLEDIVSDLQSIHPEFVEQRLSLA